jgi:Kef-type K+ transport system membrane component KefB
VSKWAPRAVMYAAIIGVSFALLAAILLHGPSAAPAGTGSGSIASSAVPAVTPSLPETIQGDLARNLSGGLTRLLIQLLVVLLACRCCSALFRHLGQTRVIGEIVAGILLGKSVFALLWPAGFQFVFPADEMPRLYFLSQIGLIFFMFVVGLELNLQSVRKRAVTAVMVSHASIAVPFLLGSAFSLFLYKSYVPASVAFTSFALFMGIATSITAFPVLARIIKEKNLQGTPLGDMALTCAAVDDITAWFILAAVIGLVKAGSLASAAVIMVLSAIYVAGMVYKVGPALEKKLRPELDGTFRTQHFALVFTVVLASALAAELIGIHALFGAFLAGTVMPKSLSFRTNIIQRIEDVSSVALLPLFFAFTGIRMQLGLLSSLSDWLVCAAIVIIAIAGKLVGSAGAARISGLRWRESLSIGVLMNTRGLMELVVLNLGYDLGILPASLFAMMVIMALATTMMAGPLLGLLLDEQPLSIDEKTEVPPASAL